MTTREQVTINRALEGMRAIRPRVDEATWELLCEEFVLALRARMT